MKKNLSIFGLLAATLLTFNISSASADPTYAVLDANGNVTNIIVCGSACASGEFGGNKVVLQVAADPVTGENRGGFWYGPGTTTYDSNSGTFTMVDKGEVTNSSVATDTDSTITSSATIYGGNATTFKYEDTIGTKLETRENFNQEYLENTSATISVNKDNITESLDFNNRKTAIEIQQSVENSNLVLLNSKIQKLISLLGSWVK
jgi:hypothetical protein